MRVLGVRTVVYGLTGGLTLCMGVERKIHCYLYALIRSVSTFVLTLARSLLFPKM